MTEIAIIAGSTRPGRRSRAVAEWVAFQASRRHPSVGFGIVDLADFALPVLDEAAPARGDHAPVRCRTRCARRHDRRRRHGGRPWENPPASLARPSSSETSYSAGWPSSTSSGHRTAHQAEEHVQRARGTHPGRPFTEHAHDAPAIIEALPGRGEAVAEQMRLIVRYHESSVAGRAVTPATRTSGQEPSAPIGARPAPAWPSLPHRRVRRDRPPPRGDAHATAVLSGRQLRR
jgi:NADPH-dependent FMN reductase